ncbi:hypothetical protein D5R40_21270 [Okeania hirsuta]|uniref:Uncharacterized protein n=1 Tax=Okeania hirsuta TaxID=1458930 RepID=A0A3N6NGQ1_9CYAN|nr:hypothetical protein D4Z78_27750 [Okeania hirsuta]RQH33745.1 hypothetical protein D5R40_21270 [Okeania hirsuta]
MGAHSAGNAYLYLDHILQSFVIQKLEKSLSILYFDRQKSCTKLQCIEALIGQIKISNSNQLIADESIQ